MIDLEKSILYVGGVRSFIDFVQASIDSRDYIKCLCWKCKNLCVIRLDEVEILIIINGIDLEYTRWVFYIELYKQSTFITLDSITDIRNLDENNE